MRSKINVLTTGTLANDPLIQWAAENFTRSNLKDFFKSEWIIVTHSESRAESCMDQAKSAPMDVSVLIDENSRNDRTSATRRAIQEIPQGELVWMFPEGLIPEVNAGSAIKKSIEISKMIAIEGNKCSGLDHLIFERPNDKDLKDNESMLKFFSKVRDDGAAINTDDLIITRNAKTDMQRLSVIYWTLKYHQHHYTDVYEPHLEKLRNKNINLLEIGIAQGASLRTFRDYFYNANVFGLDIYPESVINEPRIKSLIGDSTLESTKNEIRSLANGKLDVIIDDGNHNPTYQINTFKNMFNLLNDKGIYFIEDVYSEDEIEKAITEFNSSLKIEKFNLRKKSGYGDSFIIMITN